MNVPLVMTLIGPDRPGLVELVAGIIADHHGNWLESRMCQLGGKFAGVLRAGVPHQQEESLVRALSELEARGLTVVVHADRSEPVLGEHALAALEIVGQDRPGIVRQISRALADQRVNVEEFRSECTSAPMSGETLFKAQARVQIPHTCDLAGLQQELEKIAGDLLVDISFQELPQGR